MGLADPRKVAGAYCKVLAFFQDDAFSALL